MGKKAYPVDPQVLALLTGLHDGFHGIRRSSAGLDPEIRRIYLAHRATAAQERRERQGGRA